MRFTPKQIERMWGVIEEYYPALVSPCVTRPPAMMQCNPPFPSGYTSGYNYTCQYWDTGCVPPDGVALEASLCPPSSPGAGARLPGIGKRTRLAGVDDGSYTTEATYT